MKRYELIKATREFPSSRVGEIKAGCAAWYDEYPELIDTFETEEEAFKALENYTGHVYTTSGFNGILYEVEEYCVQEVYYNEQDEEAWAGSLDVSELVWN